MLQALWHYGLWYLTQLVISKYIDINYGLPPRFGCGNLAYDIGCRWGFVMHISRAAFDRARLEGNLENYSRLVPIKIEQVRENASALSDLASASLRKAFLTATLRPGCPELRSLFRDAAQCGAAVFVLARAGNRAVDFSLASETTMRLQGPVPPDMVYPARWLSAVWCAMGANDYPSLINLCHIPGDMLRKSPIHDDEFSYWYADAVRAFWTRDPAVGSMLLEALRATEPEMIRHSDVDYVMSVNVPTLNLFYSILEGNVARFQEAMAKTLEGHKQFWGRSAWRNTIEGLVALPATALAGLGKDQGLTADVTSDYVPPQLMESRPHAVDLVCCPYCIVPIANGTAVCPACLRAVDADAPIDMESVEYFQAARKQCGACGSYILRIAVICPTCRTSQS